MSVQLFLLDKVVRCGLGTTCEQVCQSECGVISQKCQDPTTPKCTYVGVGPDAQAKCIADGAKLESEACTTDDAGHDDCAKGLFCSKIGLPGGGAVCRRFCSTSSACSAGQSCGRVFLKTPEFGLCYPTCSPFAATSACTGGAVCKPDAYTPPNGYCGSDGKARAGTPCGSDDWCEKSSTCSDRGVCEESCDIDHPCSTGKCKIFDYTSVKDAKATGSCNLGL